MASDDDQVLLAQIGQIAGKLATRPSVYQNCKSLHTSLQARSIGTRMHRKQINSPSLFHTCNATTTEVWRVTHHRLTAMLINKDSNTPALHGDRAAVAIPHVDIPEEGGPLHCIGIEPLY
jgi:hypothetical protein